MCFQNNITSYLFQVDILKAVESSTETQCRTRLTASKLAYNVIFAT